ncbi:hypothetical protein MNKW57_20550 [Biformimicrobium ophioploci]|uniref:Uncharacterized protein n=1 Tax=Biformimicrobium ophioploci TaxID=3036711 RepID=A0ABQ6M068_9GAMM|nr:hypothetical protein MNKW57_20550 [Microbulbifer sp. NKW57]
MDGGDLTTDINVAVKPVSDAPVANDDVANIVQNSDSMRTPVLDNDADLDGCQLIVEAAYAGNGGTEIIWGELNYEPANEFEGSDSVSYTIAAPTG